MRTPLTFALMVALGMSVPPIQTVCAQGPKTGAHYESQNSGRERIVVFVHGFTGNSTTSWQASNGAYFPSLFATDPRIKHADVFVASYETHWTKENSTILILADKLFEQLNQYEVMTRYKDIVFVCHSLGGLVVERMLISHPTIASKTSFIQFFGTPHEGAFTEISNPLNSVAAAFGENSLIPELRAGSGNLVLVKIDSDWRAASLGNIRRFCAIEAYDTTESVISTFHGKVVSYFSGAAGCDPSVPVDTVYANHINMVKISDRVGQHNEAYLIFLRNYRNNPYRETTTSIDNRRDFSQYFQVDCERTTGYAAYPVTFPLNAQFKEELVDAKAELVNRDKIKDVNPEPPVVTSAGPSTVNVHFGFNGLDKSWGSCPGGGHATLVVHPNIRAQVPIPDGE